MIDLRVKSVGEFQANCYLLVDDQEQYGIIVDPGAESEALIGWIGDLEIQQILITHAHQDHVGALEELRNHYRANVGMHRADAVAFTQTPDIELKDGQVIGFMGDELRVVELPGHTPGSIGLEILDGSQPPRVIVGDAIFPGGPGHTTSPEALQTSLESLENRVFNWSDDTVLYPGHGTSTTVGTERESFMAFIAQPRQPGLHGDVTWR